MWLSSLILRLRALVRNTHVEREMEDELCFHLEMRAAENRRQGMKPEEARRDALRSFGGLEQTKEKCRDARGTRWLEALWQELGQAGRSLFKERTFSAACVVTVALGIAALTSVFSIFYSALMRPLPYEGQKRLVAILDSRVNLPYSVSFPCYQELRGRARTFAEMGLFSNGPAEIRIGESTQQLGASFVTASVFQTLSARPVRGRVFGMDEDHPDGPRVAVISSSLWRSQFGEREDVLGKQIVVKGRPRTIIGVLPSSFEFPQVQAAYRTGYGNVAVWAPLQVEFGSQLRNPGARFLQLIASVPSGVDVARARDDFRAFFTQMVGEHPEFNMRDAPVVLSYRDYVVGDYRPAFFILLIAGFFVMAIACANVANLFLIRIEKRRRELAVRMVLGAGKIRLWMQSLAEAMWVACSGCFLGLLLARWSLDYMRAIGHERIPRLSEAAIGTAGFGLVAAATLLAIAVIGALPHLRPHAVPLAGALSASSNVSGQRGRRVRDVLVTFEIALAMVLLIGAGLMIRSVQNLFNLGLGFDTRNVLTFFPSLPAARYQSLDLREDYCVRLEERLAALSGVLSVGRTSLLPLWEGNSPQALARTEEDADATQAHPVSQYAVSTDYFRAMGIPILKGRGFATSDSTQGDQQAVIIDAELANKVWPKEEALGRALFIPPIRGSNASAAGGGAGESRSIHLTVIGIVPAVRKFGLRNFSPMRYAGGAVGAIYRPTGSYNGAIPLTAGFFAIKSQADPFKLVDAVRRAAAETDRNAGTSQFTTMEDRWREISAEHRFYTVILDAFGFIALLLAAVGIYGVVAYSMAQRTHEFGVRMALGAGRFQIMRLAVFEGVRFILTGASAGFVGGLFLCRFLKSMLFQVEGPEALTLAGMAAVLAAVAFAACFLPARRASRLDPWTVLRVE